MTWPSSHRITARDQASAAGFTLLEMIVVLVILGLAIAVVAGTVPRRSAGLDLAAQTDTLASSLRLARAKAIAQGRPIAFAALPGGSGWLLDGVVHPLPPGLALAVAGPRVVRFDPDGSATGATLTLVGQARSATLRVDWLTGRVIR